MKQHHLLGLWIAVVAAAGTAEQQIPEFAHYRIVVDNNVFDPERGRPPPPPPQPAPPPPPQPDYIDVVGILVVGEQPVVLTRGSQNGWNGEFRAGDRLADFDVVRADTDGVVLSAPDKTENVATVGSRLLREDDAWRLISTRPSTAKPAAENAPAKAADSPAGATDRDELLRRLRERRMKELNP